MGRKRAIIISYVSFGICTWLTVLTTSVTQMAALRFLAGIGIGGFMPNIIALMGEFAPRRLRATLIIVSFVGVGFGGGLPGPVAAYLVPTYGWQILFTIGGILPIVVAGLCWLGLPELIKYLTITEGKRAELLRVLRRLRPDRTFGPEVRFVIGDERQYARDLSQISFQRRARAHHAAALDRLHLQPHGLFLPGELDALPAVERPSADVEGGDRANGVPARRRHRGWAMCWPIDKKGLGPVAILFAVAVPCVALIGLVGPVSESLLMVTEFCAGFCVLGLQSGINAIAASIYPTSYRSIGTGWALGMGRVGAMIGPVLGGVLIARHLPTAQLFIFASIPFAVGAVVAFWLMQLYSVRFKGTGLGQRDVLDRAAAAGT